MPRARCRRCHAFMDDVLGDGRVEIRDGGPVAYYFVPLCWSCAASLRVVVDVWLAARAATAPTPEDEQESAS